jgi:CheY-like chemotaxis protein
MLSDLGHTVHKASSGREALRLLTRERIDLLITDYSMPDMNGSELAEAVQAGWRDVPILVISGYAELPVGLKLRFRRLSKPFVQEELEGAIAEVVPDQTATVLPFRSLS